MKLFADFILVSGFAINMVLLIVMAITKRRELPQNLLMVIFSLILVIIITLYTSLHQLKSLLTFTRLFEDGARFLIGPLIYLYIKSIFIGDENFVKKHLVHFTPFLLYWIFFTVPIVLSTYYEYHVLDYLEVFKGQGFLAAIKDIYVLIYILFSIKLFLKFKNKMKSNYSSFTNANYVWIRKFLIGMFMTTVFDLLIIITYSIYRPSIDWDMGIISVMFLILIIFYLGYHGLKQSMIYLPEFLMSGREQNNQMGHDKQVLPQEELESIKSRLDKVLLNKKPYLEQELTLSMLAELVNTSDKKLSVYLNHTLNISFYDFINRYRVEEVKEKLKLDEYSKYSLLGIAYTCGFNSKSSFYRVFKKQTGISPTDYKNQKIVKRSPTISNETSMR